MSLDSLLTQWTEATANLKWGVQRVFTDVFKAAQDGKTTLIYGQDYRNGSACLVNTVGAMLTVGGGHGIPSANFSEVVGLFDQINAELFTRGVNVVNGYVSPLAANVFLHHFAPLKDVPDNAHLGRAVPLNVGTYIEPSDEEMARDLVNMFLTDAPCEIDFSDDLKNVEVSNDQGSQFTITNGGTETKNQSGS